MPYNTRRKSLSLSELGIVVPKRQRSGTSTAAANKDTSDEPVHKKPRFSPSPLSSPPLTADASDALKTKKLTSDMHPDTQSKTNAIAPTQPNTQQHVKLEPITHKHASSKALIDTPPTSPKIGPSIKVDTEGIKDEIVVAVIHQLEATANRPQTSKELAAVLGSFVPTITSSTNPNALIQARLANYLKGHWPIVSPCPLAKQHEQIHPRRVFYYLTTMPVQSLPDPAVNASVPAPRRVISPELSSASSNTDDDHDAIRARFVLSPSPEVVLVSPDLEDQVDVNGACDSFDLRGSLSRDSSTTSLSLMHNNRAISPPLERQERDFKKVASDLKEQRRNYQQASRKSSIAVEKSTEALPSAEPPVTEAPDNVVMSVEVDGEADEAVAFGNKDAVTSLFGNVTHLSATANTPYVLSSPLLKPQHIESRECEHKHRSFNLAVPTIDTVMSDYDAQREGNDASWAGLDDLQSPETIDLDELETLLDSR